MSDARGSTQRSSGEPASLRAVTGGELLVAWHHEPSMPVRYRLVASEPGSVTVITRLPLLHGLGGVILRLLPQGDPVHRSCMVASCRRRAEEYMVRLVID